MAGSDDLLRTPLRATYERVRALPLVQQMRECVDLLENPSILASDLAEAYVLLDTAGGSADDAEESAGAADAGEAAEEDELTLEHFYPGREITIHVAQPPEEPEDRIFQCLTGAFHPGLPGQQPPPEGGLDYVGLLREPPFPGAGPVLGAVESLGDATPYALLLRLLSCLTEMATPAAIRRLDRGLFKGALGTTPVFDLHLVLWQPPDGSEGSPAPEQGSIFELTRDLAEAIKAACGETPQLSALLGAIACLRMNPDDFEGRLELEWSL